MSAAADVAASRWNTVGKFRISPVSGSGQTDPSVRIISINDPAVAWHGKYVAPPTSGGGTAEIYVNTAHSDGSPKWASRLLTHELAHAVGLGDTYDDPSRVTYGGPDRQSDVLTSADISDYLKLDDSGTRCGSAEASVQYAGPAAAAAIPVIAVVVASLVSIYGLYYVTSNPTWTGREVSARIPFGDSLGMDWVTMMAMVAVSKIAGDPDPPRKEWEGEGEHAEKLPKDGDMPYVPPKQGRGKPVKIPERNRKGYVDEKGRYWEWDGRDNAHGGPHWDVQLNGPKSGPHKNVYPNGHVRD